MKYDVSMRVFTGPKTFDDVTVTVEAASGDEAAEKGRKLADSDKVIVKTIMPTPHKDTSKVKAKK